MKSLLSHIKQFLNLNILNKKKIKANDDLVLKFFELKDKRVSHVEIYHILSKKYDNDSLIEWLGKPFMEKLKQYNSILNERFKLSHENYKNKRP